MNNPPPMVHVAHPGTQHSFRVVRGLEQCGRLGSFTTTLAFAPKSWLGRRFPARATTGIPMEKVRCMESWREWVNVLGARLSGYDAWKDVWWLSRNRAFGVAVGRSVGKNGEILLGFDTACAEMFVEARRRGLRCVLDQTILHSIRAEKILGGLAKDRPSYSASLSWTPYDSREVERRCQEARLADLVLCASEEVRDSVIEAGAEPSRARVVPFGIDLDVFKPVSSRSPNSFRVIFSGHLTQRKGVGYLLEAWKLAGLREAELVLAGDVVGGFDWGPWLSPSIRLLGRVRRRELVNLLQQSHVFALPTSLEGQANAVLEAMACGCCVVTTRASGIGGWMKSGENGILLKPDDIEAWAETFKRLASDRAVTEQMGRAGVEMARSFSLTKYGERLIEALKPLEDVTT